MGERDEPMDDLDSEWQRKGAKLSDKTARKEFGLTQDEIIQAIRAGKLHWREASMHGNPWLRLLRRALGGDRAGRGCRLGMPRCERILRTTAGYSIGASSRDRAMAPKRKRWSNSMRGCGRIREPGFESTEHTRACVISERAASTSRRARRRKRCSRRSAAIHSTSASAA